MIVHASEKHPTTKGVERFFHTMCGLEVGTLQECASDVKEEITCKVCRRTIRFRIVHGN